jgi:two-component system, NarL family, nitrate/nitrite response regulator NarL
MIIDPVTLFREGLRRILYEANFQPVWCSDLPPIGALPLLSGKVSPLLIIGTDVEEAIVQIADLKRHYPSSRVVLLMNHAPQDQLVTALRCGADTLLVRRSSCETLINTLKLVLDGAAILPSDLLDALLELRGPAVTVVHDVTPEIQYAGPSSSCQPPQLTQTSGLPQTSGLSERELDVLQRLQDGLPNKQIARNLGITEATVKTHVKAILRKTGVQNRTQVAMWASKRGLGELPPITP